MNKAYLDSSATCLHRFGETEFTPWGSEGQNPRGTQIPGWETEMVNSDRPS